MPLPAARPEIAALSAPGPTTPEATASIPADGNKAETKPAEPQLSKPVHQQARKQIQKHGETARERAKRARREYLARKYARERAAYLARERLRHMSPSEKRRLYFENLDRQRRARSRREANFTDIWR